MKKTQQKDYSFSANVNGVFSPSHKQSGATLIVALIILLIVTTAGLSTIGSTSLEVKMAANHQFDNIVFQESEHAIESSVEDMDLLGEAYADSLVSSSLSGPINIITMGSSSNGNLASSVQAQFVGFSSATGEEAGSIRMGASGYSLYNYEIRGTAILINNGAANTNVRGVYIVGATPD
jgi:hypothetical protein